MKTQKKLREVLFSGIASLPTVAVGAGLDRSADRPFVSPTELWLTAPRLQRALAVRGVSPEEITGAAADYEKLIALLGALSYTVGSTLAADLAADLAYLCAPTLPTPQNGDEIWRHATAALAAQDVTPRSLLSARRTALVAIDVTSKEVIAPLGGNLLPLPVLDQLFSAASPTFARFALALGESCGIAVTDLPALEGALAAVLDRFAALGAPAVLLDVSGLSRFQRPDPYHAAMVFSRALAGEGAALTAAELALWQVQLLRTLGRLLAARGMRLVLRVRAKTEHVMGDFSTMACRKLFSYLAEQGALVQTLLSLPAGELPAGLSLLLDRFRTPEGAPLLYFGIEGAGAGSTELRRSLRYYLRRDATPLLLGITDTDIGFFSAPTTQRFAHVLAAELAAWAGEDGQELASEELLLQVARSVMVDNVVRFFGISE